jgi:ribosomal protein S18 acetylase RimI-like enzyme
VARRDERAGVSAGVRVRRIRAGEADALRDIRLRALADEPLAFGSTHAREAGYPPEQWAAWTRDSAEGRRQVTYFATADADDAPRGMAFAVIDDDDAGLAHLFAVWVAPEARRTGAGAALVAAVIEWATAQGAQTLRTAVTIGNDRAAHLYERAGFRDTGVREPLGHSDGVTAVLERRLGG